MATGVYVKTEEGENAVFGYCCKYNEGVGCHPMKRQCGNCGWNPEVAKERLARICFELGIDVPEGYL